MRKPKIEVFRGYEWGAGPNDWYFHLRGPNGEVQNASEGYKTRAGAIKGAKAMKRNAAAAEIVVKD